MVTEITEHESMRGEAGLSRKLPSRKFPEAAFLESLHLSDYERSFFQDEYGRGLDYYLCRLDRLMLRGKRVLDAGCGIGQWSLALSHRFDCVDGIDIKGHRLETFQKVVDWGNYDNISIKEGSITQLPYEGNTFDAIFCYGVIMFTPIRESLQEFYRVLTPGGRIYVCLNADGWFEHLLSTQTEPKANRYVRQILARTAIERAQPGQMPDNAEFVSDSAKALVAFEAIMAEHGRDYWRIVRHSPGFGGYLRRKMEKNSSLKRLLLRCEKHTGIAGRDTFIAALSSHALDNGKKVEPKFYTRLLTAFGLLEMGTDISQSLADGDPTRAYEPAELDDLVHRAGFTHFQWAAEGTLICDTRIPEPEPIYAATLNGKRSVWEALFEKPDIQPSRMSPAQHLAEAVLASQQRVHITAVNDPIVSSGSRRSYPIELYRLAEQRARLVGQDQHLDFLAATLCEGADSETEKFRRLLVFVQQALYRDPVSQPLNDLGKLPTENPVAILMTHRGRCGHAATVLSALLAKVGIESEKLALKKHISLKAWVNHRWVLAEADIFKNGVIPTGPSGDLLTIEEVEQRPTRLDVFPATGWMMTPSSSHAQDVWRQPVQGYMDAMAVEERGFVSGYFSDSKLGHPPTIPQGVVLSCQNNVFTLSWEPSVSPDNDFLYYRVSVGRTSRGWTYENRAWGGTGHVSLTGSDVYCGETTQCKVSGSIQSNGSPLYAAVTAVSRRVELESETWFWPSDEVSA